MTYKNGINQEREAVLDQLAAAVKMLAMISALLKYGGATTNFIRPVARLLVAPHTGALEQKV